jgi:hypothetical protein
MICRPLALEEIEQSSQELPLKTSGGYWRSFSRMSRHFREPMDSEN